MRLRKLTKLLVIGGSVAWLLQRARRAQEAARDDANRVFLEPDPDDPVQGFEEAASMQLDELDIDAQTRADAEAAQDLATMESEIDDATLAPTPTDPQEIETPTGRRDAGELYGTHVAPAMDREPPDDDTAQGDGKNWLEALTASSTEYGPEPEHDVDPIDTADVPPHPSESGDKPVADKGSGGIRGL